MTRRRGNRLASVSAVAAVALALPAVAAADSFGKWNGTKGPYSWEAKRKSCGAVTDDGPVPNRLRAHTRWRTSPADGYTRLTYVRQVWNEDAGGWKTVQRQKRSTKNTKLEGERAVLHWTQFFNPHANEAGAKTRQIVVFEWFRDRPGPDPRVQRRKKTFTPCKVGSG